MSSLPIPDLPFSERECEVRFNRLQDRLVPLWKSIRELSDDPQTIVVLPSLTVDFQLTGSLLQAYEERFLFLLLLLRQPNARIIYVTSQAVDQRIIDYYLGLLPGVIASHARKRLFFVAPFDGSADSLVVKLLKRPRLIEKIRRLIAHPHRAHLVPFVTTKHERNLALRLGIPLYGADPKFHHYGTKSGCRRLFSDCGVSHPAGFEDLRTRQDVINAIAEIRKQRPDAVAVMVKLNEGVSGAGNAVVDLRHANAEDIPSRIEAMVLEDPSLSVDAFFEKLGRDAGIVEERIVGDQFESPSAQLRVTPLGEVQLISTHDQMLGGPSGQKFSGCRFPADADYAAAISRESLKVGQKLAAEGVLGRFAIDFVAARSGGEWKVYAIELNLRKGGTTHPYLTLQFLTDGRYQAESATFHAANHQPKCFVATDNLEEPEYRAFTIDDVFDLAVRNGLHFDPTRQTGVVFHMLSALGDHGRLGLTAVGNSHAEAESYYRRTTELLHHEARISLVPPPPPDDPR